MMTIKKLNSEFKKVNPTGEIRASKKSKKFDVIYSQGEKVYTYTATSLVKLAEKLDIVPEINIRELAQEIANRIMHGETDIIEISGASDTVNWILRDWLVENFQVDCECYNDIHGLDDWNRQLGQYNLKNMSGW